MFKAGLPSAQDHGRAIAWSPNVLSVLTYMIMLSLFFWLRLLLTTEHTFIFKKWIYFYILWDYNALEENMFFFQAMGIRAAGAFSTCVWTSVCGEKALRSGCIHPSATSTKTTTTSIKK